MTEAIHSIPWDTATFGIDCFEILEPTEEILKEAERTPGHYTIKIDPLSSKSLLQKYGFYYTDTLVEPRCSSNKIVIHDHSDVSVDEQVDIQLLLPMCNESFVHGRFHRDSNISHDLADLRYRGWLEQLGDKGCVLGLIYNGQIAGFIAHDEGNLLLHAVDKKFRGLGLSKYLWSAACHRLIDNGITEIRSSISAGNLAALNLYASLGFRFNKATDVYHRLTQ